MNKWLTSLGLILSLGLAAPAWAEEPAAAPVAEATAEQAAAPAEAAPVEAAAPAAEAAPAEAAAEAPKLDSGNTAWMLTSTALVLFMTIPGLALFYGGMVRKKGVLAVMMQSFAITAMISVLWMIVGYSLAFSTAGTETVEMCWPCGMRLG